MKWYYYVIGGIVFLAIGGLVLYGVLTHKEQGLMNICWENGIIKHYDDPIKSPHPECKQNVQWDKDQLPLTVFMDLGKDHEIYRDSIVKAMGMWNSEVGPMFVPVTDKSKASVVVSWGTVSNKDHIDGYTVHHGDDGKILGADVVLSEPSDLHAIFRYAAHELGHVLGLAHDESGLMRISAPGATEKLEFVLPSDYDKSLLKELYFGDGR